MAWIYLTIAGMLEVGWAIGMKYSVGLTRFWPSFFTIIMLVASFVFLSIAVRTIPIGTGYAIWTGIGAAGTAILGIILFNEPASLARLACLALIVTAIIGLKLTAH